MVEEGWIHADLEHVNEHSGICMHLPWVGSGYQSQNMAYI